MAEEKDRSCGQQQHLHFPLWDEVLDLAPAVGLLSPFSTGAFPRVAAKLAI